MLCLLTALRFHDIGTQTPKRVWLAIPARLRAPKVTTVQTRFAHMSGKALTEGIERRRVGGAEIRVISP